MNTFPRREFVGRLCIGSERATTDGLSQRWLTMSESSFESRSHEARYMRVKWISGRPVSPCHVISSILDPRSRRARCSKLSILATVDPMRHGGSSEY